MIHLRTKKSKVIPILISVYHRKLIFKWYHKAVGSCQNMVPVHDCPSTLELENFIEISGHINGSHPRTAPVFRRLILFVVLHQFVRFVVPSSISCPEIPSDQSGRLHRPLIRPQICGTKLINWDKSQLLWMARSLYLGLCIPFGNGKSTNYSKNTILNYSNYYNLTVFMLSGLGKSGLSGYSRWPGRRALHMGISIWSGQELLQIADMATHSNQMVDHIFLIAPSEVINVGLAFRFSG